MPSLTAANKARLQAALDKQYRFDRYGVLSLGEWLKQVHPAIIGKNICIQEHTTKRVHLCYEKLAEPKTIYQVCLWGGRQMVVPKIVWDTLDLDVLPASKMF